MRAKLIRIGNSRGIRVPRQLLVLYGIQEDSELELEQRMEGILIRPVRKPRGKLSWNDAYRQMAAERAESKEWSDWGAASADGLEG
jgi:antitoxin MazE